MTFGEDSCGSHFKNSTRMSDEFFKQHLTTQHHAVMVCMVLEQNTNKPPNLSLSELLLGG